MSILDKLFNEKPSTTSSKTAIIDFSNLLHSSFHAGVRFDKTLSNQHERYAMWRYIILNQILNIKSKLQPDEIVLAIDSSSWRKEEFQYYKATRALLREQQTDFDYQEFYDTAEKFIGEITATFPYKVIRTEGAEADDVIAVLAHKLNQNIIIVSRDKDFKQLLKYKNVTLYDPIDKKFKEEPDPFGFLDEHILKGDRSDGIPNMLSDDNVFVNSDKRQKKITKNVIKEFSELGIEEYAIRNNLIENYERNKKLIDLSLDVIPRDIQTDVIYLYNTLKPTANYMMVVQFLRKNKIKSLEEKAGNFL